MNVGMRPGTGTTLLLTVLAVLATAAVAGATDGVAGKWRTEVEGRGGTVVLIMQLQQDQTGRWIGTIKNNRTPDEIEELKSVAVDENKVTFFTETKIPDQDVPVRSDFDLRLTATGDQLRGAVTVNFQGVKRDTPMQFTRVVEKAGAEGITFQPERPLAGAWNARPDESDKEREIQLEIVPAADGYAGTLTDTGINETVGLRDLVINDKDRSISFNFRFEGAPFMSSYWGRWDEEQDRLRGSMSIGGRSQRIDFRRTSAGPESLLDEFATAKKPLPRKHPGKFAGTVRLSLWKPLYVLKEKERNINDITTSSVGFDAGVRFHILDYFAVQARYVRGGLGFDTNEANLALFDPVDGPQGDGLSAPITTESFLEMDGFEFSLIGYLGQSLFPTSRFNPYLIGVACRTSWALGANGRGSDPIAIYEEPLEGTDWTFGGGLGTEYALSQRFGLEVEWVWTYTLTEDEAKWSDVTYQWTNQHVFRWSLGGIIWF